MEIKTDIPQHGEGKFSLLEGSREVGEMIVELSGRKLIVHHTEISPGEQGKDLGKKLLAAMVDYARTQKLQVIPRCPYVLTQFKRHKEFADVWKRDEMPQ